MHTNNKPYVNRSDLLVKSIHFYAHVPIPVATTEPCWLLKTGNIRLAIMILPITDSLPQETQRTMKCMSVH